jgi:hypothetical protein
VGLSCFSTGHDDAASDGLASTITPDLNRIEMVQNEFDLRVNEKQTTSSQHMWELL